jgi:polysaccharide biosynthesis/export protein
MTWYESNATASCPKEITKKALSICSLIVLCSVLAQAQDPHPAQARVSELAQKNMSLVAASASEIKAVLLKDAGLMVELKRWVAKDATNHGQVIGESDLTNDAIFDRLETDAQFRSVATLLVQRYGYLVPNVNPESPLAKEQELLMQERVKWITQEEQEARTEERSDRQQQLKDLQKARACAAGVGTDCPQPQPSVPLQMAGQTNSGGVLQPNAPSTLPEEPPLPFVPAQPNMFGVPNQESEPSQQGQLLRASEQGADDMTGLGIGSNASGGAGQSFDGLAGETPRSGSTDSFSPLLGLGGADDRLNSFGSPQRGSSLGSDFGTLDSLAGSSSLSSGVYDADVYGGQIGPQGALATMSPAYPAGTPVVPWSPYVRDHLSRATVEPAMTRVPNPYRDVPSLYDMYLQASPHPAGPRRFGVDIFENGIRDPQLIPMDLPAGPDYVVGPGDGLSVSFWGGVSRRVFTTVDREGRVNLPEVGPVLVSGQTLADAQRNIQQVLRTQFRDVSADVSLSRLRTIRVYEVGDVASPGAYDISSLSTPLNALFAAGGPTPRGSLRIVKHYRGNQLVQVVDLYDLLLRGVRGDIERLDNGDTILVPPIGPQVTIDGMVRRPAIYELKDEKDLASVLALGGGLLPTAALRHIEVQRLVAHEKQTMLSLDIPDSDNDAEVTKKLESFKVQDGDRIRVFPIAQGNEDAVYLQGHVIRPGRYAYRADMRVTDVISSFKDLLPEPALQYAEIIRLNAPDFHPTVESFDLSDALDNPSQSPTLHPMDTVRIFSRFDFENPPTVSVLGDVRDPGTYQTSGQVHLSDAVHLAGGLAPDAEKGDAQVFRYLPDGKAKIFSVNLSEALSGNTTENLLLEPRDRVLIHRSPDAAQPATVYVEGAVEKAGRYPLATNMTIADLIRVGGGLKPSADTQIGDLTLYQHVGDSKLDGQHEPIELAKALAGDPNANLLLHNGDVVTIRELPGWNDLGASISVRGEVKHPGTYGIRPGERLSSIVERAGGFQPDAYPYGAVLQRVQVRELEAKQQDELVLRVKDAQRELVLLPDTDPRQKQAKEAALAQYQTTLTELGANPPLGRVTIRISSNIDHWRNTPADVEVRAGDTLVIPKHPDYVMVTGQVFNPTAVSYRPGKSARWYLSQSGGPTTQANKKDIFVIRADGSVTGGSQSLWGGDSLSATLQPGDTVVVPEKAFGGGPNWQTVFLSAQVASSIVSTVFIATHY